MCKLGFVSNVYSRLKSGLSNGFTIWAPATKVRQIRSTVAKNLNSTYHFVNLIAYFAHIPKTAFKKVVQIMRGAPLYVYYIQFGQYTHPMGSGRPPWASYEPVSSQCGTGLRAKASITGSKLASTESNFISV